MFSRTRLLLICVISVSAAVSVSADARPVRSTASRGAPKSVRVRAAATAPGIDAYGAALSVLGSPADLTVTRVKKSLTGEHVRFAQVAVEYEMPVTPADKRMMLEQCGG